MSNQTGEGEPAIAGRVRVTGGCVVLMRVDVALSWSPGAAAVALELEDAWYRETLRTPRTLSAAIPLKRARDFIMAVTRLREQAPASASTLPSTSAAGTVSISLPAVTAEGLGEADAVSLSRVAEPGEPWVTAIVDACVALFDEAARLEGARVHAPPRSDARHAPAWLTSFAAYVVWVALAACVGWGARACGLW